MTWSDSGIAALALAVFAVAPGVAASAHALLNKRRPRAAFGWIGVCLMFPVAGAALYFFFGINRTRRRAQRLRDHGPLEIRSARLAAEPTVPLLPLAVLGEALCGGKLRGGNAVEVLHCGEAAYPAMLSAIDEASAHVLLSTYIFDTDETGHAFAEALGRAVGRGVDVRVLLDGVGELYTLPRARRMLARRGVQARRFLPPRLLPPSFMMNLRNHRKVLVVDDRAAFTGGMNISDRHLADRQENPRRVVDTHFRIRGPVLADLAAIFHADWAFAGGLDAIWLPEPEPCGESLCRAVADGPDEELDRLLLLLVGAIGVARRQVAIMTPYFIPPRELLGALQAAALRGVDVSILLPGQNNLFFMQRATRHLLWELLQRGVRIYYQPAPFVHSKLFLVDDGYAQIGSANLDPRSLRLNFELAVEVYDTALLATLHEHYETARRGAEELSLAAVDGRRLPGRLLDGLAWLFSPYL